MAVRALVLALMVATAAVALVGARTDHDFEFDDTDALGRSAAGGSRRHQPRRFVYSPHNELCRTLECRPRELCLLREGRTAFCAEKRDVLRRGDLIVSAGAGGADDEDVFYEEHVSPATDRDRGVRADSDLDAAR
ncbi:unnamed protein product [Leptidea sinapis]|uniref:Uncharacterized protein n=1 Tax=Leptidea sinapis TaxID=189913 RepID=A0A5E4PQA0_9NEOP|nr:unnamed protein product [Leptidea sinapis]